MRKTLLILVLAMANLTACGAENAAETKAAMQKPVEKAAQMAETAATAVTKGTTQITEASMAAVKAMGAEMGIDNFDAAKIVKEGDAKFKAGEDYVVLTPAQPTSSGPSTVEVAEVFMYGCPHCYSFEPFVQKYIPRKPVGVNFIRIPAQFNKPAELHAAAYYAAEALGVGHQVHTPLFQAIHVKRNPLNSEKAIKEIFVANGVDGDDFDKAFSSFDVDTKVRQSRNLNMRYKVTSVPMLIINGKYQASGSMAKSMDRLDEIVDYLVAKEMINK